MKGLWLSAIVVAMASLTGCYAESHSAPAASTTTVTSATSGAEQATNGYEPAYFDGYVVFYTDEGKPFHYGPGGSVVWIPASSTYYDGLSNHYRANGPSYSRWYASTGYRYHAYRGPAGHYYYAGYVRF